MATIPNPPVFDDAAPPADQQTLVWDVATGKWKAVAITSAAITVPAVHENAPAAITAAAVVAANASAPSAGYVQAEAASAVTLANAEKTTINALVTDVTNLRTELATLVAALQGAAILAAS